MISLLTAAKVKVFCDLGKPYFKKNVSQVGFQETVERVAFAFLLGLYSLLSKFFLH